MPNPKDISECGKCGVFIVKGDCACNYVLQTPSSACYRGCHKVHLECANKKIEEAIIEIRHARDLADIYRYPATVRSFEKWLESLGEK